MGLPRVLLVDDHPGFRGACAQLLDREFAIVGQLDGALELTAAVKKLAPDAILLDISMPGISGLDAAEQLLKELPKTKIVFLSALDDRASITRAFQLGAAGYVLKRSATDLMAALHQVLEGKRYLSPALDRPRGLAESFSNPIVFETAKY